MFVVVQTQQYVPLGKPLRWETPPFKGHKLWSQKNAHITFVSQVKGTLFLGIKTWV